MLATSQEKTGIDLCGPFLFLYLVTLHADQWSFILGGFTVRVNNLLAFVLIALLLTRFRFSSIALSKKVVYPLLWITVSLVLSLILSPYKQRCLFYFWWYGLTILCYLFLPYFLMRAWEAQKVFSLYCLSFICVGLYASFQVLLSLFGFQDPFVTQHITEYIARPNALAAEPSFYALYMTPFVFMYNYHFITAFEQPFFIFRKKKVGQALWINALYLISTSGAVFFAYTIFCLIVLVCHPKKVWKFLGGVCGGALLLIWIFPFLGRHFFLKFFFNGFMSHHSFYERWIGIVNGWKIFLRHPFFGVGLGGYPSYLMEAYLKGDTAFTFLNIHHSIEEVQNPIKLFEATNVVTELLASLGLFGACALFSLLALVFLQAKKVLHYDKELVLSLLISVVMTLLILQFNQGLFRTYIWAHLALVFAFLSHQPSRI